MVCSADLGLGFQFGHIPPSNSGYYVWPIDKRDEKRLVERARAEKFDLSWLATQLFAYDGAQHGAVDRKGVVPVGFEFSPLVLVVGSRCVRLGDFESRGHGTQVRVAQRVECAEGHAGCLWQGGCGHGG